VMRSLVFLFTIAGSIFAVSVADALDAHPIEVRASVQQCSPKSIQLRMTLTNTGKREIEIYRSDLPWGIKSSIVLVLVPNTPDPEMIKPALYIDDPGPDLVSIGSSQTVSGSIDLQHRFPDLAKALSRRDVLVFWSYRGELKDGATTYRASGSVLLESAKCVTAK
jgi:hypothetical protein